MERMAPRTVTIIQARMGSTRLPGKVLMPLGGEPSLAQVIRRVRRAHCAGTIVVATSDVRQDDMIEELCLRLRVDAFRGDEQNVLDRYYQCANAFSADVVIRITADCPLLSPQLLDMAVTAFFTEPSTDYFEFQQLPRGVTGEVISMSALCEAWRSTTDKTDREHVTPFIVQRPEQFQVQLPIVPYPELRRQDLRLTLDTPADYDLISELYRRFGQRIHDVCLQEIILAIDNDADLKLLAREGVA